MTGQGMNRQQAVKQAKAGTGAKAGPGIGGAPLGHAFCFDNTYARLPAHFYARQTPTPVKSPVLIRLNRPLAAELGLDEALIGDEARLAALFSGNAVPDGAEPIAQVYAGHQFGQFVPRLGDGRALLLGEVVDKSGVRRDIQLKGAGRTPFSRRGDGRAALGPVMREYILSEAMHALGTPTTRALAMVRTGEAVFRERTLPGAILTRVARGHVRVGTFAYFAARGDEMALSQLTDYMITRHYPEAREAETPALALLEAVMAAQARLVAGWMCIGFIHGVMNTDNMAISGETIDYGPCAFMDGYDPGAVFSSIDHAGRYAYANQGPVAQWNLTRFAETLLPLLDSDADKALGKAQAAIETFPDLFVQSWLAGMGQKLGLEKAGWADKQLIEALLRLMHEADADFTLTFRAFCDAAEGEEESLSALLGDGEAVQEWTGRWKARLYQQGRSPAEAARAMRRVNPAYIPRNHRIEEAIKAASEEGDFAPMDRLMAALAAPYEARAAHAAYARPPREDERVTQTFCGT